MSTARATSGSSIDGFNVVPAGQATCIGRGPTNPPILEFNPSGKLVKSFGAGLFAYNHGFTMDADGNLWVTDVNDQETILGMSARNANGAIMGQEVLKLSPEGKVLMVLGKEGVAGTGPDAFDRPTSRVLLRRSAACLARALAGWKARRSFDFPIRRKSLEGDGLARPRAGRAERTTSAGIWLDLNRR